MDYNPLLHSFYGEEQKKKEGDVGNKQKDIPLYALKFF